MPDHHPLDEAPQTPTDEGLRCPACEYNLTGLAGEVCPECGEAFDRARLLAELNRTSPRIPIWSDRDVLGGPDAFVRTLLAIWSHPFRYVARFPLFPDFYEVRQYALWCLIVTFLCLVCESIPVLAQAPYFVFWLAGGFLILAVGVILIEWFLAAMLFVPVFEGGKRKLRFRNGLALLLMSRSFLVFGSFINAVILGFNYWVSATKSVSYSPDLVLILAATYAIWPILLIAMGLAHRPSIQTFLRAIVGVPLVVYLVYVAAIRLQAWF